MIGLLVLGLLVTACSGDGAVPTSSTGVSVDTTTGAVVPGTTLVEETSGRPLAPEFDLELGEGGVYTLTEAEKPVYLVFWAEWCPTCRRQLPIVDRIAAEYSDQVDFVAPAWKSTFEATRRRAEEIFQSGAIMWGLDADQAIFELYGVPYQPVTVLIASDGTVVETWDGLRAEDEIRASLDDLVSISG